ncbi:MAG: hypothetical protein IIY70_05140, partial [Oscillospiraceae bacterium]|nr:hypothetical protein [Oscillospiraceae bacterium]
NGITLASNEQTLYSIEMILELSEVNAGTLKPGIYEFGCLLEDRLYIETSRIPMGNYIFYEGETFDEGVLLGYGMERFLDYLFASNFNPYWRWVSAPAETIHYLVI